MTEEWRDVPGYEGRYQISIDTKEGRCRSLNYEHTGKPKDLSNKPGKRYNRICWKGIPNDVLINSIPLCPPGINVKKNIIEIINNPIEKNKLIK